MRSQSQRQPTAPIMGGPCDKARAQPSAYHLTPQSWPITSGTLSRRDTTHSTTSQSQYIDPEAIMRHSPQLAASRTRPMQTPKTGLQASLMQCGGRDSRAVIHLVAARRRGPDDSHQRIRRLIERSRSSLRLGPATLPRAE